MRSLIKMPKNQTNETLVYDYDEFLTQIGSTWFWDGFFLFVMPFVGLGGSAANAISFYVFCQKEFQNQKLYALLRFYTLTSCIGVFMSSFDFYFYSRRFLWFTNTYGAFFFNAYIHEPITNTCYFINSVIDTHILLDLLSIFSKRFKFAQKISAPKAIISTVIFCIVVNIPYYFVIEPTLILIKVVDIDLNSTKSIEIFDSGESAFAHSTLGRSLIYPVFFIRDILTLATNLTLNMMTVSEIKLFLRRKIQFNSSSGKSGGSDQQQQQTMDSNSVSFQDNSNSSTKTGSNSVRKAKKADHRAMKMVCTIGFLSTINNLAVIAYLVYGNFFVDLITATLDRVHSITGVLKFSSNFLVFYLFNENFKGFIKSKLSFLKA